MTAGPIALDLNKWLLGIRSDALNWGRSMVKRGRKSLKNYDDDYDDKFLTSSVLFFFPLRSSMFSNVSSLWWRKRIQSIYWNGNPRNKNKRKKKLFSKIYFKIDSLIPKWKIINVYQEVNRKALNEIDQEPCNINKKTIKIDSLITSVRRYTQDIGNREMIDLDVIFYKKQLTCNFQDLC